MPDAFSVACELLAVLRKEKSQAGVSMKHPVVRFDVQCLTGLQREVETVADDLMACMYIEELNIYTKKGELYKCLKRKLK